MPTHEPKLAVFRHASDNPAFDCGRACAQSIISSLTQGVAIGKTPTAGEKAQPVPYTQDTLRLRESAPLDVPGNWFTHPDELVQILNGDPHLISLGLTHWKVAAVTESAELFERVGRTLQRGMPAILNIRDADHWVTVRGVDYANTVVSMLYMLDPLNARNSPGPLGHTYYDGCAGDGTIIWEYINEDPADLLATWSLPVGTFPPANYAGKFVAIVYEPPPIDVLDVAGILRILNRLRRFIKRPKGPTPPLRIREELQRVAAAISDPDFTALVEPDTPLHVRHVHDIDARLRGYTIASFYDQRLERGLIGTFDFTDQLFRHLRLTTDRVLVDSIAGDPAEPLWWTERRLDTLFSPYFPFQREKDADGRPSYRRLLDGVRLEPPESAAR
ncbi:MAG: hypothetical protein AB7U83_06230 [Vicinamibacterales bacterium]